MGPVRLADCATGVRIAELDIGEDNSAEAVAFSRDGSRVAVATTGIECWGEVQVWDLRGFRKTNCIETTHSVWSVTFSPDDDLIASSHADGEICIWKSATGELMASLHGHEEPASRLSFSEDGAKIVSASNLDHTIRVWEWRDAEPGRRLITPSDHLTDICLSSDASRLVTRSENGTTHLWDGRTGALVRCLHENNSAVLEGGHARDALFVDEHRFICLGSREPGITICDALTGD